MVKNTLMFLGKFREIYVWFTVQAVPSISQGYTPLFLTSLFCSVGLFVYLATNATLALL